MLKVLALTVLDSPAILKYYAVLADNINFEDSKSYIKIYKSMPRPAETTLNLITVQNHSDQRHTFETSQH